jgi:2,4-dienoyl-CoA reductase-like NADH-dependent reductase (Old Yellow Enzyme family)
VPTLFTPFQLKDITLRNRIAVPPMCQYSAVEGVRNDWHQAHYRGMARGGAGLVIVEATGVSPEGRISPGCTGLWNDAQAEAMASIARGISGAGAVPGIQIAHAGRKASANVPWEGDDHIPASDPRAWQPLAPSAIPYGDGLPRIPKAMTLEDIARVQADFVAAARRAHAAKFQWLELHFSHGYLAQSFFSAHSNQRTDQYGGSFDNRARFLLETLAAVRAVWPQNLPLAVRLGVIEYDGKDEETVSESIDLVRRMRAAGLDFLNVTVNFVIPGTQVPWGTEAFLAPIAQRIRNEARLPVAAAWGMDAPHTAARLIADEQLDLVMIGRAHLANPHYAYQLALTLGHEKPESLLPAAYAYWLERYRGAGKKAS